MYTKFLDTTSNSFQKSGIKDLSTVQQFSSVSELVEYYNNSLQNILEAHAPVRSHMVTFSKSALWFTSELRQIKTAGRALERRYVLTNVTVHKMAYREHQKIYSRALATARLQHYSNIINTNPGNSKQLFSPTINHLLSPHC